MIKGELLLSLRHCERSEAIQSSFGTERLDCFVAALLAMTVVTSLAPTTPPKYRHRLFHVFRGGMRNEEPLGSESDGDNLMLAIKENRY